MSTTYNQAYIDITAAFNLAWVAYAGTVTGYLPEVRYKGIEKSTIPAADKYWIRFSMQPVTEGQSTFRDGEDKRYTTDGLIFIQIFGPRTDARVEEQTRKLAMVARDIFRGKSFAGGVWFRNVRINDLEPEDKSIRKNVVAEYTYDEIG